MCDPLMPEPTRRREAAQMVESGDVVCEAVTT